MGTGAETPAVSSHRRAGATRNVTEINSRRVKSDRQDRTARPNGNDESATAERQDPDADYADYADLSEPPKDLTARRRQSECSLGTAPGGSERPERLFPKKRDRTGRTACRYAARRDPRNRRNLRSGLAVAVYAGVPTAE